MRVKPMTRPWLIVMSLVALLGGSGENQAASPPERVNFQGVLRDATTGATYNGTFAVVFSLYDTDGGQDCTGGNVLLTDAHSDVVVSGGVFNAAIGTGTLTPGTEPGLAQAFANHTDVWVQFDVNSQTLCPRAAVNSSAYSLNGGSGGGGWVFAYEHDDQGQPIEGSISLLMDAYQAGGDFRVRLGGIATEGSLKTCETVTTLPDPGGDPQFVCQFTSTALVHAWPPPAIRPAPYRTYHWIDTLGNEALARASIYGGANVGQTVSAAAARWYVRVN